MDNVLSNSRVLMFVEDVYEDLELWYPKLRLAEAGAQVVVAGPEIGRTYHGKHSYPCKADAAIDEVQTANFDGVVIPGGFMPDKLRRRTILCQKGRLKRKDHRDAIRISCEIPHPAGMPRPHLRGDVIEYG